MSLDIAIIIPCFNEEKRLPIADVLSLLARKEVRLLFVDDGSTDGTPALLAELLEREPERVKVVTLAQNRGKAEAVRKGLRHAMKSGAQVVGYVDADMATPAEEVFRLLDALVGSEVSAVIGARVAVLGANIRRKHSRHYLGRVFATFASLILSAPIYDTQCGAKLFRATPALKAALKAPFRSRWAFDVELIGRLITQAGDYRQAGIIEIPLREWIDRPGSKVSPGHMVRTAWELTSIAWDLHKLRRGGDAS